MTLEELKQCLTVKPSQVLEDYGWTQCVSARDKNGQLVAVSDEEACQFCASGALYKAYHLSGLWPCLENTELIFQSIAEANHIKRSRLMDWFREAVMSWNDYPERTKKEVVAAFKKVGL